MTDRIPELVHNGAQGCFKLRAIRRRDLRAWREVRMRNQQWLAPWEATIPPESNEILPSFGQMVARLHAEARAGRSLPFVMTLDGALIGQLTVGGISWGSMRSAHIGYWIDQRVAGRGLTPLGVALAVDHCFLQLLLHRIEIVVRPENSASLRVPQKLGFRTEGLRPQFLHIDGHWRDHVVFALHAQEARGGLLARWSARHEPMA